jgi:hypothetical protein
VEKSYDDVDYDEYYYISFPNQQGMNVLNTGDHRTIWIIFDGKSGN